MHRTTTLAALALAAGIANAQSDPSWQVFLADSSGNGVVDAADYTIWRNSIGDFNRDGDVDAGDYIIWRSNFGQSGSPAEGRDAFDLASNAAPLSATTQLAWGTITFPTSPTASADDPHKDWIPILSVPTGVAGDYNNDGVVDAADYTVWRENLGAAVPLETFLRIAGDFDSDGDVDAADYTVWRDNLGNSAPPRAGLKMIPGDYTGDGVADTTDYTVWRDNLGSTFAPEPSSLNDWWWTINVPCPADLNGDGVADNGDLSTFVALFFAGDTAADLNADGFLDNGDIAFFVAAFLAGC